ADQLGDQCFMTGGERRYTDGVNVVFDRVACYFGRRLEERSDIDVETEIGECGCDDLRAAIVPILSHLGDQDSRPTPLDTLEFTRKPARLAHAHFAVALGEVDARNGASHGLIAAPHAFKSG